MDRSAGPCDPIAIELQGDITTDDDPESSGDVAGFTAITIRNRTKDSRRVRLAVEGCPAGWIALINETEIDVGPLGSATAMVEARLVSRIGVRRQLEPIVVTATTEQGTITDDEPAVREVAVSAHIGLWVEASEDALSMAEKALKKLDPRPPTPQGKTTKRVKLASS